MLICGFSIRGSVKGPKKLYMVQYQSVATTLISYKQPIVNIAQ